jgi:cob(I)alamin adenosyltransferase
LLELGDVLDLIDNRPPHVELVLTGRNPPQEVIDRADLVTEMVEVRHHYRKGVLARKGIDC